MKTIYISGIIGLEVTANDIREQVDPASKERLRVIINSNGGLVSEGFEIYNILKSYKGGVEMIIGVMAASVASYIAMSAPKDNRKAFKNSSFMVHEASAGVSGRARDFAIYAERLEGVNNIVADAYSEGGIIATREQAREMMAEDKYFTGWEALVENNIISDVIDLEDVEIPQKEEDEDGFFFFETLRAELDKTPDMQKHKEIMYSVEEKVNSDLHKSNENMKAIAAYLKPEDMKNEKANEPEHKNVSNPDNTGNDKSNTTGDNMNLQEFLKSNPEAQAEYNEALASAEAKGKASVEVTDMMTERKRIYDMLEVASVPVSETLAKAIDDGLSVGDFAKEELRAQRELRNKDGEEPVKFGNLTAKQTPGEQDEKGAEELKAGKAKTAEELKAFDEESKALAEKYVIGGGI